MFKFIFIFIFIFIIDFNIPNHLFIVDKPFVLIIRERLAINLLIIDLPLFI